MTKIGINIKKIRAIKGYSQQYFAELFDLSRGNISSYEENRAEPKLESVIRIANYFSIPLQDFIEKKLTVNEILKFNADKLHEEEDRLTKLQLCEVPYINEHVFMKCNHKEMQFTDLSLFPKLVLPETANHHLLALAFSSNIPHHAAVTGFHLHDILVFEEVTDQNFHLCANKVGLYIDADELMLGQFISKGVKLTLVLNELKKSIFRLDATQQFWRLFAVYHHVID